MVTFKEWVNYTLEERQSILLSIIMGDEDMHLLDDIDPNLRVEEPTQVPNWMSIQSVWLSTNRLRTHSSISIETAEHFLAKIEERIESRLRTVSQTDDSRSIEYSGWHQGRTTVHNTTASGPGYTLFEDLNAFNGIVQRLMVQPDEPTFESYKNAILHIVNENPIVVDSHENHRISITFEVFHPIHGIQPYTFSTRSNIKKIQEQIGALMDEEEGSDTYTHIRENIVRVFINIIKPSIGSGYASSSNFYLNYFIVTRCRNKASCFYWCIRKIKQSHLKNNTYRKIIFDNPPPNFSVPVSMVGQALTRLEIKGILLCNKPPTIELIRNTVKYDYYEDIVYDYVYLFDCYYYEGSKDNKLRIFSNAIPEMGIDHNCGYIIINNIKYYLMIYGNDHYEIVKNIILPDVCHKCGSTKHNAELAKHDITARTDCLNEIRQFLGDVIVRENVDNTKVIFFDAETIPIDGYHHPYMVAYQICDLESGELIAKDIIETYDCFDKFLTTILHYTGTKYIVGYNSSSFDNYFLLRSIIKYGYHVSSDNTILHHNKLLKTWIKGMVVWDLYQFTKCSLADACRSYKIGEHKDEMNHDTVAEIWKKNDYKVSTYVDPDYLSMNVRQYCEKDVEVTKRLFFTVYKDLATITSMDPLSKPTISSLAYSHMQKHWKENAIHIEKIPMDYNDVFSSIPGGRTQVFKRGEFTGDFVLLDVNSLYPYTCLHNVFPVSKLIEGRPENDQQLYLAYCRVDQSCLKYKMLGVKNEEDRLDWTRNVVEQWIWKEQVEALREQGCTVDIIKTIYWKESKKIFDIMAYYRQIRNESQDNIVRSKLAKMLGNSNTGKLIETNHVDVWDVCNHQTDIDKFVRKYHQSDIMEFQTTGVFSNVMLKACKEQSDIINKPRHIGSRIYALSRLYMWKLMMKCEHLYYSDTDSLLVEKSDKDKLPIGDEYGQLKIEDESSRIIIVSPKTYYVGKKKGLKGYKPGDPWEIIRNGDVLEKGNQITVSMYEALLDPTKTVQTKYYNMRKEFVKKRDDTWELLTIQGDVVTKILS